MDDSTSHDHAITEEQAWSKLKDLKEILTTKRNTLATQLRTYEAGEPVELEQVTRTLQETQRAISDALPSSDNGPAEYSIRELIEGYWEQAQNRKNTATTGFSKLVEILSGGFEPLRLVGVLGAPNCGKTTFTHQIADHVANSGRPVLYVTSEDTPAALLAKTLARIGKVKYSAVLKGWESEKDKINEALATQLDRLSSQRLRYLDATNGILIHEIRDRARAHFLRYGEANDGGPGVLVIDYLQRIARAIKAKSGLNKDLREVVSDVTDQLRAIAYELNCTVLAIASQNRTNYARGEQGSMGSAKESGDIEYTCDVMMALNEDVKSNRMVPAGQTPIKLFVDKNRQGERGKTVDLNFWAERQTFTSVAD
ncbi:MAG: AAA family ATPase [Ktedonobacteraceae bacterium]|nr:AAA family ATPase [Ktedonobacteraceae bacterium]